MNSIVRHKCLEGISKILYFTIEDMLKSLLQETNIPIFLGKGSNAKAPDIMSKLFMKESVVHSVDMLISLDTFSCR